jgi:hypothetical protein
VDVVASLGVVFGGIAAVAAVVAAVYSVVIWRQGRRDQQVANRRWRMQVEPRLRIETIDRVAGHPAVVDLFNAGGAASTSFLAVHEGNGVFVGGSAVPGHFAFHGVVESQP